MSQTFDVAALAAAFAAGLQHALEAGLRLDFFGDELETLRTFDPNSQRSTGTLDEHLLGVQAQARDLPDFTELVEKQGPTVVNISTSGTATAGADYTGNVATVTIPADATTATITRLASLSPGAAAWRRRSMRHRRW